MVGHLFSRNVCEVNLCHLQAISAVEASGRGYEIDYITRNVVLCGCVWWLRTELIYSKKQITLCEGLWCSAGFCVRVKCMPA